jgi:XRE family transcriptional regulator, regulator of sulfur utilization
MSHLNDRFPRVVRQLREARGWSQERLAEKADLNRSYVGEIERGSATPSLVTADKLAQALELDLSALVARCEALLPPQTQ